MKSVHVISPLIKVKAPLYRKRWVRLIPAVNQYTFLYRQYDGLRNKNLLQGRMAHLA